MEIKVGSIVHHAYRREGNYLVAFIKSGTAALYRVKKQQGWPLAGQKSCYTERDFAKLTPVDFSPMWSIKTELEIRTLNNNTLQDKYFYRPIHKNHHVLRDFRNAAMQDLVNLASELSPENLTCDGELSGKALIAKKLHLLKQWAEVEQRLQEKWTEDEVWDWYKENSPDQKQ